MVQQEKATSSWHLGEHCNRYPNDKKLRGKGGLEAHVLYGWMPATPPVRRGAPMFVMGSCFARQLAQTLVSHGRGDAGSIGLVVWGGEFVTAHAVARHLEWLAGMRELENGSALFAERRDGYAGGRGREGATGGRLKTLPLDEDTRAKSKGALMAAEAFVCTLGISELWYEKKTGEVFLRAVAQPVFDDAQHGHRVASVEETKECLRRLVAAVRKVNPKTVIVLTVSPVAMAATFRPISSVTANVASKAILRAAVDEFFRENEDSLVYYWPGYELALVYYAGKAVKPDGRHIWGEYASKIVGLFEEYFIQE